MMWGTYLLLLPLTVSVFCLGGMIYFNKFGYTHYFFDHIEEIKETKENQEQIRRLKKRNKIGGGMLMLFGIIMLLLPLIFQ